MLLERHLSRNEVFRYFLLLIESMHPRMDVVYCENQTDTSIPFFIFTGCTRWLDDTGRDFFFFLVRPVHFFNCVQLRCQTSQSNPASNSFLIFRILLRIKTREPILLVKWFVLSGSLHSWCCLLRPTPEDGFLSTEHLLEKKKNKNLRIVNLFSVPPRCTHISHHPGLSFSRTRGPSLWMELSGRTGPLPPCLRVESGLW